jgi:hypothetical protein
MWVVDDRAWSRVAEEEKEGRLERKPLLLLLVVLRMLSRELRAGVDRPEALIEGCRLRVVVVVVVGSPAPLAAMARSMEAWETPERARPGELAAEWWCWPAVLARPVEMLARAGAPLAGTWALRPDTEEEDRARREGVGWVAPVI